MHTRTFNDIKLKDVPSVGGKNASLEEMLQKLTGAGSSQRNLPTCTRMGEARIPVQ